MTPSIESLEAAIDDRFPDSRILVDLTHALFDECKGTVTVGDDEHAVNIPVDCALPIVTKSFVADYFGTRFGTFAALVAVGGIERIEQETVVPTCCFASLYYNKFVELEDIDFHLDWR